MGLNGASHVGVEAEGPQSVVSGPGVVEIPVDRHPVPLAQQFLDDVTRNDGRVEIAHGADLATGAALDEVDGAEGLVALLSGETQNRRFHPPLGIAQGMRPAHGHDRTLGGLTGVVARQGDGNSQGGALGHDGSQRDVGSAISGVIGGATGC